MSAYAGSSKDLKDLNREGPSLESTRATTASDVTELVEENLYRGTSLIRCGDSENGRCHVLDFENVHEKRSVARSCTGEEKSLENASFLSKSFF